MTLPPLGVAMDKPEWLTSMEAVLEELNKGVVITNEDHRILFANSRFVEMTGLLKQDLIGSDPSQFYSIPLLDNMRHVTLYDLWEISESTLAARVSFEFELRDSRTGTTVGSRYYSHDEPVDGKNVKAVVAAMDRNVQSGLREVIGGLEQYFLSHTAVASAVAP